MIRQKSAQERRTFRGTTVLVTGASSGIGAEFARKLAARGADVVLVARRRERLDELARELQGAHGVRAEVLTCDLAAPDASARLVAELDERGIAVDSLAACAGFGLNEDVVEQDPNRIGDMLAVNVVALTELSRLLLPRLLASGRGFLLTIASTAAYQPTPGAAVYGATKAYVLSFTEALAEETRHSGLRVLALSPGPTRTEFFDVAGSIDVGRFQSAAQVVDVGLAALEKPHGPASVVSGVVNRIGAELGRITPRRLVLPLVSRAIRR